MPVTKPDGTVAVEGVDYGQYKYTIPGHTSTYSPVDASTYFFGNSVFSPQVTVAGYRKLRVVQTGRITAMYLDVVVATTLGSGESSTVSIRLNDTTDYTFSTAVLHSGTFQTYSKSDFNIPVTAGDYIELKIVTPTWVTNPTNVYYLFSLLVEVP